MVDQENINSSKFLYDRPIIFWKDIDTLHNDKDIDNLLVLIRDRR